MSTTAFNGSQKMSGNISGFIQITLEPIMVDEV